MTCSACEVLEASHHVWITDYLGHPDPPVPVREGDAGAGHNVQVHALPHGDVQQDVLPGVDTAEGGDCGVACPDTLWWIKISCRSESSKYLLHCI